MGRKKCAAAVAAVFGMMFLGSAVCSCDLLGVKRKGEIHIMISDYGHKVTKAGYEMPDTNDFILEITDPSGDLVYHGPYGQSNDSYSMEEGVCRVYAASGDVSSPAFDAPVFGDLQYVDVVAEKTTEVKLSCRQINSGLRLVRDKSFIEKYPDAAVEASCENGTLPFSRDEKRTGYFPPGKISLTLKHDDEESTLAEYMLEKQNMLTLSLSVIDKQEGGTEIKCAGMEIDTARIWLSDSYAIGGPEKGESADNPLDIREAKASIGSTGVWVRGYIVGGDMSGSATGISFEGPFSSRTNLAIASRAQTDSKSSCMSVQLSSGIIRDSLNLVDNPGNLGKSICLKGDIVESYYGIPGIKNVTQYIF